MPRIYDLDDPDGAGPGLFGYIDIDSTQHGLLWDLVDPDNEPDGTTLILTLLPNNDWSLTRGR